MRLLTEARSDRPWFTTILRSLQLVTAALVAGNGLIATVTSGPVLGTGLLGWIGVGGAVAATAAMVAVLVRGVSSLARHVAIQALMLGALSLGLTSAWNAGLETSSWWPMRFTIAAAMFAVVAGRSRWRWALILLPLTFHLAARLAWWAAQGLAWDAVLARQLAAEFGMTAFNTFLMLAVTETLLRAGEFTDRVHAESLREADRAARASARERSAREVERFIHDEVLHTLRTIAMSRKDVPAATAQAAAARLAGLLRESTLTQADGHHHLAERIRDAADGLPLTVTLVSPDPVVVPEDVESAMVLATMEALRNVHRHAGTARATVRVSREGFRTEVVVSDEGSGFDLAQVDPRWGLVSSIHQRMWDVGGDVDIRTRPGEGTAVSLTWTTEGPTPDPQFRNSAGFGALSEFYALASWIALPYFGFALWNAAWLSPLLAVPWAGWASSLLVVLVAAAVSLASLRRGPRPRCAAVLAVTALTATALNGWALPDGVSDPHLLWAGNSALAVLVPLALFHRAPLVLATGFGTATVVLGFALEAAGPSLASSGFLPSILVPVVGAVSYWAVRQVLDGLARETHRTREDTARSRAAAQDRAQFIAGLAARMERRRDAIAAFVGDVAAGRLDPHDPGIRARADALERAARDQMLPDVAVGLQDVAGILRGIGHSATVRLAGEVPHGVQERGARALGMVVAAGHRREPLDVTLTIMRSGPGWRIALTARNARRRTRERLIDLLGPTWTSSHDSDVLHLSTTTPEVAHNGSRPGTGKGA